MWEIFAGHPPFDDKAHDGNLILNIVLNGTRPPLLSNMPSDYSQMMQKCWDADPSKRPTIGELWDLADNKLEEIYKNDSNNNDIDSSSINNDDGSNYNSQQTSIHKSHPLAYHKSRILDDDIAKSKELKIYTSNDSSLNDIDIDFITLNINLNKGKLKIRLIENCYC